LDKGNIVSAGGVDGADEIALRVVIHSGGKDGLQAISTVLKSK
jgi:hypothetical protein